MFVEEQPKRVERIVDFVEDRRDEHPHRLIALYLLESRSQSLGAARGFLGGGESAPKSKVVRADAEESADEHRRGAVDDDVQSRESAGEGAAFEPGLRENVEAHVCRADERAEGHIEGEATVVSWSLRRVGHRKSLAPPGAFVPAEPRRVFTFRT